MVQQDATKFTAMQQELLGMFAMDFSEQELTRVKAVVVQILNERLNKEMDKLLEGKDVHMWADEMLHMNMRPPSNRRP